MNINGISADLIRSTLESMETLEQTKRRQFKENVNWLITKYEHEQFKENIRLCETILDDIKEELEYINEYTDESLVEDNINDKDIQINNNLASQEGREVKILLDTKTYGRKPSKDIVEETFISNGVEKDIYETGMVNMRLVKNQVAIRVNELIEEIIKGKSFTLAAFKYGDDNKIHRTKACWESQDLLALDFDQGITPEEFLERSKELNLMPTFVYTSFSDNVKLRKFRAVYVLKERLYDYRDANTCTLALMELFKECDKACKDPSRLYYGGREIVYKDITRSIDPYEIIDTYCYSLFSESDNSNYKRNIRTFCSKVALNLENGLPKKNVANVADSISIYRDSHISDKIFFDYASSEEEIRQNCINVEVYKKKAKRYRIKDTKVKRKIIKNIDLNEVKCPFWRMFLNGDVYPFDDEFMHICLNILSIKGGEKVIRKAIDNMPMATDGIKKLYKQKVGYYKNRYLNVSGCQAYCPRYKCERKRIEMDGLELTKVLNDECNNEGYTMLDTIINRRGNIRKIDDTKLISIKEAREELNKVFNDALLDNNLESIHVIKADAGVGKTEAIKSIDNFNKTVIAYSNHKLGSEISERLSIEDAIYLKDIDITDKGILEECNYYLNIGYYKESHNILKRYMEMLLSKEYEHTTDEELAMEEANRINEFLSKLREFRITTKPILCTHSKMLNLNNKNVDTYVIDEDIVPTLCPTVKLNFHRILVLEQLAVASGNKLLINGLRVLKGCVMSAIENRSIVIKVPAIHYDKKEVVKFIGANAGCLQENIIDMLSIKFITCDSRGNVVGIIKRNLPKGKIIIMSATANETVYKELFKDRNVVFHRIDPIKPKGNLVLHYGGYSRSYFNKNIDKVIKRVKDEAEEVKNIITFKKYKHHFEKEGFNVIATYGACSGIDRYNGQDLIVAGTPHCNDSYYKLMAALIRADAQVVATPEYQNVKRNGFEFYINTFNAELEDSDSELLREIQYYYIESELAQAVGRARLISNDATVHYFASYPLVGSKLAM